MRRIVVMLALAATAVVSIPEASHAAKKPKLPNACVEALRLSDVLAVTQETTSRAGAQLAVATEPFLRGSVYSSPEQMLSVLQTWNSRSTDLRAAVDSGTQAVASYRAAAQRCRQATR